jgi:hypothetical protein
MGIRGTSERRWAHWRGESTRKVLWWFGLLVALLVSWGRPACAQQRAAAELLFDEGKKAMDAGDFTQACAKFEESNRLDAASGTTLNLANCEERRGRVASAWERYRAAVQLLAEGDRRREFAQAKVRQLEPLVPRLTIVLSSSAPRDTTVSRNGKPLTASLGIPLPLDPGEYRVLVQAPGHRDAEYAVTLEEGELKGIEVQPGEVATPEQQKTLKPVVIIQTDEGQTERTLGYVFGGIGAASLVGAAVFGVIAYRSNKIVEGECLASTLLCRSSRGRDASKRGATSALLANILGATGAVSLGVGAYFLYTAPTEPSAKMEAGVFSGVPGVQVTGAF